MAKPAARKPSAAPSASRDTGAAIPPPKDDREKEKEKERARAKAGQLCNATIVYSIERIALLRDW